MLHVIPEQRCIKLRGADQWKHFTPNNTMLWNKGVSGRIEKRKQKKKTYVWKRGVWGEVTQAGKQPEGVTQLFRRMAGSRHLGEHHLCSGRKRGASATHKLHTEAASHASQLSFTMRFAHAGGHLWKVHTCPQSSQCISKQPLGTPIKSMFLLQESSDCLTET